MIFQFILKVLEKTEVKALCMSVKFFNTEMCNVAQQWEWAQRLILGCFINMIQSKDKPVVTTFESTLTLYNTMLHNCTMLHFIFHSIIKFKVFNIVLKFFFFKVSALLTRFSTVLIHYRYYNLHTSTMKSTQAQTQTAVRRATKVEDYWFLVTLSH